MDPVSWANNKADSTAQATALGSSSAPLLFLNTPHSPSYTDEETHTLKKMGRIAGEKDWIFIPKKLTLPNHLAPVIVSDIRQSLHIGPKALHQFPGFHYPHLQKVIGEVR